MIRPNDSISNIISTCVHPIDKELINYKSYISSGLELHLILSQSFWNNYFVNFCLSHVWTSWTILQIRIPAVKPDFINNINNVIQKYFSEDFDLFNMKYKNFEYNILFSLLYIYMYIT